MLVVCRKLLMEGMFPRQAELSTITLSRSFTRKSP